MISERHAIYMRKRESWWEKALEKFYIYTYTSNLSLSLSPDRCLFFFLTLYLYVPYCQRPEISKNNKKAAAAEPMAQKRKFYAKHNLSG